jgi:zinc protease
LNFDEINNRNLDALASDLLGGGFTSKLMREVRVKRGLTYSIGSYISSQKQYGRAGISTFTKNETVNRLVEVINDTVSKIVKQGISDEDLERTRMGLVGSHPFKFEDNKAYLLQLLYLDHVGFDYDELFSFADKLKNFSKKDVKNKVNQIFGMEKQTIFILGDKSIEKELKKLEKKFGKMTILDFNQFI